MDGKGAESSMSKKITEETARLWAVSIVEKTPLGYRTEDEHRKLENFADQVCKALLTEDINDMP
jgi:hypothetical protein